MAYCSKCGTKNEEDAEHCKKCGASLNGKGPVRKKDVDDKCEEECAMGKRSPVAKFFWGLLIIFFAIALLYDIILKNSDFADNIPNWLLINGSLWWLFALVFVAALVVTGLRIILKD